MLVGVKNADGKKRYKEFQMDDAREFESYCDAVDTECWEQLGVSIDDLPDYDYRGAFEAGTPPGELIGELVAV